jgi:RNA recognition motif-containing protein
MTIKTAFISNIAFTASEVDLQELLEEYKPTHIRLVRHHDSGQSKGYAFAEFNDEDGFKRCVEDLDGVHYKGRPLVVKEAEPRKRQQQ